MYSTPHQRLAPPPSRLFHPTLISSLAFNAVTTSTNSFKDFDSAVSLLPPQRHIDGDDFMYLHIYPYTYIHVYGHVYRHGNRQSATTLDALKKLSQRLKIKLCSTSMWLSRFLVNLEILSSAASMEIFLVILDIFKV